MDNGLHLISHDSTSSQLHAITLRIKLDNKDVISNVLLFNHDNDELKEFPKLSKKNHLIKCFYHDFNHEQTPEVMISFYSKLFSGIEV